MRINPKYPEELFYVDYIKEVLKRLTGLGCPKAALTGISFEDDKIGVYYYDSKKDSYFSYYNEKLPVSFHGTGDIYASSALGAMMRGISTEDSLAIAVDYTLECMKQTMADENHRFYGVNFETALPYYIDAVNKKAK